MMPSRDFIALIPSMKLLRSRRFRREKQMKNELADLIFLSIRESRSIEELAERLVDRGVQIVPDGAMILTRAELDALNKYQERFKGQDAEAVIATEVAKEIFAEIERYLRLNEDIAIKCKEENGEQNREYFKGKLAAYLQIRGFVDVELKRQYKEGQK
jgi:hypothetical protein